MQRRQLFGFGLSGLLAGLVGRAAVAGGGAEPLDGSRQLAKRCILLWMNGGMSHVDSLDPKADGPFRSIRTKLPGASFSEHLPRLAERADRIALLRGVSSKEGNHDRAQSLAHTGHTPNPTFHAPSLGAWVAKRASREGRLTELPPFVALGGPSRGAGFLSSTFDPFVVPSPGDLPNDTRPARKLTADRARLREGLVDGLNRAFDERTPGSIETRRSEVVAQARAMAGSERLEAFDVGGEPVSVRSAYGDDGFGRGCLAARRLVESGVSFVEVTLDGWDTHEDNATRVATQLSSLDRGASSLLADLEERDLLSDTLVACVTEFGRTPRINAREGRDHHPAAFSVWLAGAGVRRGVVHGATDGRGAEVVSGKVSLQDVVATIATAMGHDVQIFSTTPSGRPITMTEGGKPIAEVLV
jgi:uncharacterized protein (DUF1501 family)